jgi:hypothetical protein
MGRAEKKVSIAEGKRQRGGGGCNQIFQSQLSDFFQLIFINKHPLEALPSPRAENFLVSPGRGILHNVDPILTCSTRH